VSRSLRGLEWSGLMALALVMCSCSGESPPVAGGASASPGSTISTPSPSPTAAAEPSPLATTQAPLDGFIRVPAAHVDEPVVDLGYRDYGGDGPPILLLTGLGDNAAVYDELGPLLRAQGHRVVALTRRGFGTSTKALTGYDTTTRTLDDVAAITALGLESPVVVGHSIASDELVGLATRYPDRIAGVVSLDAMIDRSEGGPLDAAAACDESLAAHQPTLSLDPADPYASLARHDEELLGFPLGIGLEELRARVSLGDREAFDTAAPAAAEQIVSESRKAPPDYSGMKVPVLAIYSLPSVEATYPWLSAADATLMSSAEECVRVLADSVQSSVEQLRSEAAGATILQWEDTHHYQFLQWPQRTADAIVEWIADTAG
jgi:non-heme chloroperoxidase